MTKWSSTLVQHSWFYSEPSRWCYSSPARMWPIFYWYVQRRVRKRLRFALPSVRLEDGLSASSWLRVFCCRRSGQSQVFCSHLGHREFWFDCLRPTLRRSKARASAELCCCLQLLLQLAPELFLAWLPPLERRNGTLTIRLRRLFERPAL